MSFREQSRMFDPDVPTLPLAIADGGTGVTTLAELLNLVGSGSAYYWGVLNQSGSSAPVVTDEEHTISPAPTWGYADTGKYRLESNGSFPVGTKVLVTNGGDGSTFSFVEASRVDANGIDLVIADASGTLADDILVNATFFVRIP